MANNPFGFRKDDEGYYIEKTPDATKQYLIDFSEWLVDGDTLANVVFTIETGLDKIQEGVTPDGLSAIIKVSGGVLGENYYANAHITTVNGLEDDQGFRVVIVERYSAS